MLRTHATCDKTGFHFRGSGAGTIPTLSIMIPKFPAKSLNKSKMNSGAGSKFLEIRVIINRHQNPNPSISGQYDSESLLKSAGRQLAPANENRLDLQFYERDESCPRKFLISHKRNASHLADLIYLWNKMAPSWESQPESGGNSFA